MGKLSRIVLDKLSIGEQPLGTKLISPELVKALKAGTVRPADTALAVSKSASAVNTIKMLLDDDVKADGLSDISRGMLEKNEVMVLDEITLLSAVAAGTTDANVKDADFAVIDNAIANGWCELKVGGVTMIPRLSNNVFRTHFSKSDDTATKSYAYAYGDGAPIGTYKLDNPIVIESQKSIEFNLYWGAASASNTAVRVIFGGTRLTK